MIRQLVVSAAFIATAQCQTSRGAVTGTVLDSSGASIQGAIITLTNRQTGTHLASASNEIGVYRFDAVDLGIYNLQVVHTGFRTYVEAGIRVQANRVITLDPRLELGAAETRIEVSGQSSELLFKDSPLRGGNFQPNEVRDLPLIFSNPLSLARLLHVKEAVVGDRDARREPFLAGRGDLRVVLGADGPALSGVVVDREDHPVVKADVILAMASLPLAVAPNELLTATTNAEGKFSFHGMAPGMYNLFAFTSLQSGEAGNTATVRAYPNSATKVSLAPHESKSLRVTAVALGR
jgi:hypothetical protein